MNNELLRFSLQVGRDNLRVQRRNQQQQTNSTLVNQQDQSIRSNLRQESFLVRQQNIQRRLYASRTAGITRS